MSDSEKTQNNITDRDFVGVVDSIVAEIPLTAENESTRTNLIELRDSMGSKKAETTHWVVLQRHLIKLIPEPVEPWEFKVISIFTNQQEEVLREILAKTRSKKV